MIKLTNTEKALKRANQVLEENAKLIDDTQTKIDQLDEAIYGLSEDLNNNVETKKDIKKSFEEKKQVEEFKEQKAFYEENLKILIEEPLLSKEEYKALKEAVLSECEDNNARVRARLIELYEEASKLGDEIQNASNKTQETLTLLQAKCYKYKDCRFYGNAPSSSDILKEQNSYSTWQWAKAGIKDQIVYQIEKGTENKAYFYNTKKLTK